MASKELVGLAPGTVTRFAKLTSKVCQLFGVDVLAALLERLRLVADRDEEASLVGLLYRADRVEERDDRVPFDVVTRRVPEDVGERVALVAVQVLWSCHVLSSPPRLTRRRRHPPTAAARTPRSPGRHETFEREEREQGVRPGSGRSGRLGLAQTTGVVTSEEGEPMSTGDEWSPDEPLGTEAYRQGDVAEDEAERTEPGFLEALETDPSLDPNLVPDERELEELGAQFDDPELEVTLRGGMDDPDGLDRPPDRRRVDDDGWDLNAPLAPDASDEDDGSEAG
jgi:hypothetical protein